MKAFLLALLMSVATLAAADTFPSRPIRLVVPFPPGGGSDAVARALSTKLGEVLGQSIVVDNRAGAAGLLATTQVAMSPPDGYTLLLADTPFAANLSVYPKPGYTLEDFAPIGQVAAVPLFLVVGQHVAANNVAELLALAKAKPDKLNMASGGAGGNAHLAAARFSVETGARWTHVPYRGMGPAIIDVMSGQADLMFASAPTVMPHLKSGKLKFLAVTSSRRSPIAQEVPTLAELGYPKLTFDNWFGIVAPAKTPPTVTKLLLDRLNEAVRSPEVRALLTAQLAVPITSAASKDLASLLNKEAQAWSTTVKAANITAN